MDGNVKYIVGLSASARGAREGVVNTGNASAAKRKRAHSLLKAEAHAEGRGGIDEPMGEALDVRVATIHRTRHAYVEQGSEVALARQRPTGRPFRHRDGAQEARRVAIACSPAPAGHARWTLKLRADKMVTRAIVDAIGQETVRRTLKQPRSHRGGKHKGSCRRTATPTSAGRGKTCWRCTPGRIMPSALSCVSPRRASRWWLT